MRLKNILLIILWILVEKLKHQSVLLLEAVLEIATFVV